MKKQLVNIDRMVQDARKNGYAVLHVNTVNAEWTKAILLAAQETNSPIIIAATEKAMRFFGGPVTTYNLVTGLMEDLNITVPVALHLDHGSYEGALACIKAGFSSVMFDGSKLPFEENKQKTATLVELAKKHNCSVEAEVGVVGGKEDGANHGDGEQADPKECKILSEIGISCLAAGIGNIHGVYPANWKGLNFKRLEEIQKATGNMPLVLHGGSGIPNDQIKHAISLGVAKLNVNTECMLAFSDELMKFLMQHQDRDPKSHWYDPRKSFVSGLEGIKKVVIDKLKLTNSINKAK